MGNTAKLAGNKVLVDRFHVHTPTRVVEWLARNSVTATFKFVSEQPTRLWADYIEVTLVGAEAEKQAEQLYNYVKDNT